jgi:uncharacterized protein (TIGR02996 family)
MERALLERPDDVDAYLVYGDWLEAQGDARGELIAVQAARHKTPGDATLREREAALMKQPGRAWLGDLGQHKALQLAWRYGFVDELIMSQGRRSRDDKSDGGELLERLLAAPVGRLLRKLHVKLWLSSDYAGIIAALAQARPPALRDLFIADFVFPDEAEMSWTSLGDVAALWPALPRLEKVILQAGSFELGTIAAPMLRHFEVRTGGLSAQSIASICNARWPMLETLNIWFGDEGYGAEGTIESIAPILDGVGLGRLKHLGLMNCAFADDICAALGASRIVKQLDTLDLSMGTMSDDGAQGLARDPATFAHLTKILLADNFLDDAAQGLLARLPNVEIGPQRDDAPEDRYVSVGE